LVAGERKAISLASELQAILLLTSYITPSRSSIRFLRSASCSSMLTMRRRGDRNAVARNRSSMVCKSTSPWAAARSSAASVPTTFNLRCQRDRQIADRGQTESGYNKGTIRADIRYLVVSKDVRRHRLISSDYIKTLPCHGTPGYLRESEGILWHLRGPEGTTTELVLSHMRGRSSAG
jgi:hypothetical protein